MSSNSPDGLARQRVRLVFLFVLIIAGASLLIAPGAEAKKPQYSLTEVTDKDRINEGDYDFRVWDPNPLQVGNTAFDDGKGVINVTEIPRILPRSLEVGNGGSKSVGYRYYNLNQASNSHFYLLNGMELSYENVDDFNYTNISPITSEKHPPDPNLTEILTWVNDNLYNERTSRHELVQSYIDDMVTTNQNDLETVEKLNQNLSASLPLLTNMLSIIARKRDLTAILENYRIYSGIPLLGTEETPANNSNSFGSLTAIYDAGSKHLFYQFEWELGGDSEATAAHFHGPASLGQSAPPAINLGPVSGNSGKQTGSVVLTNPQEADLRAGLWYLNIYSTDYPGGEIRGQLFGTSLLESVAVFNPNNGKLRIKNVMVPGVGLFEADLQLMSGSNALTFELENAYLKELDADEDKGKQKSDSD